MFSNAFGRISDFAIDARGAMAIEYALIASGIGIVALVGIAALGAALGVTFADIGGAF